MTLKELETLVKEIQSQVQLNTVAINQLSSRFNSYVTNETFTSLNDNVTSNNSDITTMKQQIAELQYNSSLVGKLNKLLDVNISDLTQNDILQYDGDRWTNISPTNIIVSAVANTTLEGLTDVNITNKQDGQAICWDNASQKWINKIISTSSGGSTTGLDADAMWEELGKSSDKTIDPSHIKGNLSISGLTTNGQVTMTNGNITLAVNSTGITATGDIVSEKAIVAKSIKS